jgi:dephospho-CoA kinase
MVKILVIGGSGKTEVGRMLRERGLAFEDTSMLCVKLFVFQKLAEKYGYKTEKDCYDDRASHRQEWFDLINDFNAEDKTALARKVFASNDVYCGLRSKEELQAIREAGLVDIVLWVERGSSPSSLTFEDADVVIDNDETLEKLKEKVDQLVSRWSREGRLDDPLSPPHLHAIVMIVIDKSIVTGTLVGKGVLMTMVHPMLKVEKGEMTISKYSVITARGLIDVVHPSLAIFNQAANFALIYSVDVEEAMENFGIDPLPLRPSPLSITEAVSVFGFPSYFLGKHVTPLYRQGYVSHPNWCLSFNDTAVAGYVLLDLVGGSFFRGSPVMINGTVNTIVMALSYSIEKLNSKETPFSQSVVALSASTLKNFLENNKNHVAVRKLV